MRREKRLKAQGKNFGSETGKEAIAGGQRPWEEKKPRTPLVDLRASALGERKHLQRRAPWRTGKRWSPRGEIERATSFLPLIAYTERLADFRG
jgi:hypothetical protein